jgi:hypothetical protein
MTGPRLLIVRSIPDDVGWSPIHHMIALAAHLFDAEVVDARQAEAPTLVRQSIAALRGRRAGGNEVCLLIGAAPTDLVRLFGVPGWRTRFSRTAAWIIDSFWVEWMPRVLRFSSPFDHLFVTSGEDVDGWASRTPVRPAWLPWGTDALQLGSASASRPWDLMRVGRQPPEWDDDAATGSAAAALGLRFHPRPHYEAPSSLENHRHLMQSYARSRHVLAFSNLAHSARYTHPTRAYLTGRWVDALAAGAVVAGVAPSGACIDTLLWPGATLELGGIARGPGLRRIAAACAAWTPDVARHNHAMALQRLDWRWRFQTLADALGVQSPALAASLQALRDRIESMSRQAVES